MVDGLEKKIEQEILSDKAEKKDSDFEKKENQEKEFKKEKAEEKVELAAEQAETQDNIISGTNERSRDEERMKRIEEILEDKLEDEFLSMDEKNRNEFKKKGEETVESINVLLKTGKIKIKKIITLIKDWLSIIPGVNKFFLEQESKIKADEVIKLKDL
jgi:flagellar biosynthesis GTPase FlhF